MACKGIAGWGEFEVSIRNIQIIGVLLLAVLAGALNGCGGKEGRIAEHFAKGKAFLEKADYEKARLEFQNVLQIEPKHLDARFELANDLEKLGEYRSAAGQYMAINDNDEKRIDSRIALARIFLIGRDIAQTEKLVKQVQAIDPENIDALALQASVKFNRKDVQGAKDDVTKVLAKDDNHVIALYLKASIAEQEKDYSVAEQTLQMLTEMHPERKAADILLVGLYVTQKKYQDAAALLQQKIIKDDPKNLGYRVQLVNIYRELKEDSKAEQVLKDTVQELPDSVDAKMLHVQYLQENSGNEAAEKQFRAYTSAGPENFDLRLAHARFYEKQNQIEKARQVYKAIIASDKSGPKGLIAQTRQARILLAENKFDEAQKLITGVLTENPGQFAAEVLQGDLNYMRKDYSSAIANYRSVLKQQPNAGLVLKKLARAHLAVNETHMAVDALSKAVLAQPADVAARLQLANLARQSGELDKAAEQVRKILIIDPKNRRANEELYRVHIAEKNYVAAGEIADTVIKTDADKSQGYIMKGAVFNAQKQYDKAAQQFKLALKKEPDGVPALTALIKTLLVSNKQEDAAKELQGIIAGNDKHVVAYNLLAEIRLTQKKYTDAETLLKKAIEINPGLALLYRNLAAVYWAMNKKDETVAILDQGIKAIGGVNSLIVYKAQFLENQKDIDAAIQTYESALKEGPESIEIANNLAMLLVSYKEDDTSINRAKDLVEILKSSENPVFMDTIGWVYHKSGDANNAVTYLEKAVDSAPKSPELRYHYGISVYKQGNTALAREQLQKALETKQAFRGRERAEEIYASLSENL